ncbi:MAG: hypothetical protein U0R65_07855 [Candidatus Nanopelagicales bacterium]
MDYLSEERVEMRYTLPLAEIVFDFFDYLKSRTCGYASLDYGLAGEQDADLVKVDILLHGDADAFSAIVHKDKAHAHGVAMAQAWASLIPRQQFEVPIQAAIGSRVITRETIRAMRKDARQVLRRRHHAQACLVEKQKEGKKRMKMVGRVEVPRRRSSPRCRRRTPRRPGARSSVPGRPLGLYLHVPFCTCANGYCDFNTYTATGSSGARSGATTSTRCSPPRCGSPPRARRPGTARRHGLRRRRTPTLLGASGLVALLDAVRSEFGLAPGAEVTTEANPDTVDGGRSSRRSSPAATRGSRSGCRAPHRTCSRSSTDACAGRWSGGGPRRLAAAGSAHVSLDLIYGTPGESDDDTPAVGVRRGGDRGRPRVGLRAGRRGRHAAGAPGASGRGSGAGRRRGGDALRDRRRGAARCRVPLVRGVELVAAGRRAGNRVLARRRLVGRRAGRAQPRR